jgi:hypothetical protein
MIMLFVILHSAQVLVDFGRQALTPTLMKYQN